MQRISFLHNISHHLSLSLTLARQNLRVKYSRTLLGTGWVLLQPILPACLYTIFLGRIFQIPFPSQIPYELYVFSGLLCWNLFAYVLHQSGTSLLEAEHFLGKIGFPKLLFPLSKVWSGGLDFFLVWVVLVLGMFWWGYVPDGYWLLLPFPILLLLLFALGLGCFMSSLSFRVRDLHHILPLVSQLGIWITPVFYHPSIVPVEIRNILMMNPLSTIIAVFRWIVFSGSFPDFETLFWHSMLIICLFGSGVWYFLHSEKYLQDAR
ncbi:MAG: ABC transporter permease [Cytophagales bacterium]|nr:ABC transporter permease [Cytophagales bacterium]